MSAVDDEQRVFAPHVKPARPADGGKSFADVLVRKVPTALLHDGRRGERNGCIVQLMVAKQRQLQRVEALPVEDLAGQIVGEQMNIGKIRLVKRCTDLFAPRLDHGLDRRRFTVNDRVAAGLDDAGLRCGDLLQRVAQHLRVVKADVADDCNLRRQNHICGVKFAAHADLTDNEVAVVTGKILKSQRRDHFKLGRLLEDRIREGLDILCDFADFLVGDLHAVDLDALIEADQVGAGVQARFVSGLCEHTGQHCAGRALTVRAGHMDKLQSALGMAHLVQQRADAFEAGDTALPADGMDIMQRFVKRHVNYLLLISIRISPAAKAWRR